MKNIAIIGCLAFSACLFGACNGDHGANNGKDTQANSYHVAKDSSQIDTSKTISADNSASGGANLVKDTGKMKHDSTKKK